MIHDHEGRLAHYLHCRKSIEHTILVIATRVIRPGVFAPKCLFERQHLISFVVSVRHDHSAVLGTRSIELHAIELNNFRDQLSCVEQLRVGKLATEVTVIGSAVIGYDYPAQPILTRFACIHFVRIFGIARYDRHRRIKTLIPFRAVDTVDMVVAGTPGADIWRSVA